MTESQMSWNAQKSRYIDDGRRAAICTFRSNCIAIGPIHQFAGGRDRHTLYFCECSREHLQAGTLEGCSIQMVAIASKVDLVGGDIETNASLAMTKNVSEHASCCIRVANEMIFRGAVKGMKLLMDWINCYLIQRDGIKRHTFHHCPVQVSTLHTTISDPEDLVFNGVDGKTNSISTGKFSRSREIHVGTVNFRVRAIENRISGRINGNSTTDVKHTGQHNSIRRTGQINPSNCAVTTLRCPIKVFGSLGRCFTGRFRWLGSRTLGRCLAGEYGRTLGRSSAGDYGRPATRWRARSTRGWFRYISAGSIFARSAFTSPEKECANFDTITTNGVSKTTTAVFPTTKWSRWHLESWQGRQPQQLDKELSNRHDRKYGRRYETMSVCLASLGKIAFELRNIGTTLLSWVVSTV